MKKALVISGGGCKGAYAVGVLKFIRNRPEFFKNGQFLFDVYLGTSTGALIVPLASVGDMNVLINFYSGTATANLLATHDAAALFRTGCLFNSFKLDQLIDTVYDAPRFGRIVTPEKQVGVSAVCLQTGELRLFTTQPLAARLPHYTTQTIASRNDLVDAILASTHQPFFLEPVRIRSAPVAPARHYVDGGVREYAAIQVALDAGADEVLAVLLSPETPEAADSLKPNDLIGVLQRTIDIFSEDVSLNDVRVPDILSRGANYVLAVRQAMVTAGLPTAQIDKLLNPPRQPNPFANRLASRIHIIRPKLPLGGGPGGLRFDPVEMQGMMAKGEVDAAAYFNQLDANGGVPPVVLA
ncbi:patatin-like phospholipase family protein [Fibrella sp. HMF5335]|uniref:Patatin-like phospholipase family protein n=1 Tax=Fibrella rubiginis TaxID=2817060 RepID=A0A939GEZ4_9BACT|nr:patatin-like phospholipase family protein [Fibrella rubiginis]MBO0935999.1 patatin-like phospholipase family protein [Fibrella rubiginis]